MTIASWLKVPSRRHQANGIASSAHSLRLFGRHISLKLVAALGLIIASLTGASIYALEGSGTDSQATVHLSSTNNSPADSQPASNSTSSNASTDSSTSSNAGGSSQGSSTSTTTQTTTVNGQSTTSVTVNGQSVQVPANGTTQKKVGNSTVTITHSGDASNTSVNNTSVQVNSQDGGN